MTRRVIATTAAVIAIAAGAATAAPADNAMRPVVRDSITSVTTYPSAAHIHLRRAHERQVDRLREENRRLRARVAELRDENRSLLVVVDDLRNEIAHQAARLQEVVS